MTVILPQIVFERYREACANPDIARWRSLAYLAGFQADTIQKHEPDSVIADDLRTVSELAWQHCMDMQPAQEPEDYNSLAGVVVGWFRRMAA
jgi:hypothetical protein